MVFHWIFDTILNQKMTFQSTLGPEFIFSDFQFLENKSIQHWISLVIEYSRSAILVQTFQTSIKIKPL